MDFCNSSAFGRTVTASGHSNRFAMGRMLPSETFSYGLRSKCADLAELIRIFVTVQPATSSEEKVKPWSETKNVM